MTVTVLALYITIYMNLLAQVSRSPSLLHGPP